MRAVAHRVARRVGHRGTLSALLGIIAALYGVSLWSTPPPNQTGLRLLLGIMPMHCWGSTLVLAGVIAVACAPVRQGRDWPGWAALVMVWTPWSLSYLTSWWPQGDNPRGWISALIFAAFAGVPAVAARWDEPARLMDRRDR